MNKLVLGVLIGIAGTTLFGLACGYLVIAEGLVPARGDVAPDKFETWAAHTALHAVLRREATDVSPLKTDDTTLMAGAKVYAANCSGCHGAPANPTPDFAKGFNPGPTLFGNGDDVTDDPEAAIYWKVKHGIKFTGMPAFSPTLTEKEMWEVTTFLKNQDKLPVKVAALWKSMK